MTAAAEELQGREKHKADRPDLSDRAPCRLSLAVDLADRRAETRYTCLSRQPTPYILLPLSYQTLFFPSAPLRPGIHPLRQLRAAPARRDAAGAGIHVDIRLHRAQRPPPRPRPKCYQHPRGCTRIDSFANWYSSAQSDLVNGIRQSCQDPDLVDRE